MPTFRHHTAHAHCNQIGGGAEISAVFHGSLCLAAFEAIVPRVLGEACAATVLVVRMDGSLTAMRRTPKVQESAYGGVSPEGCIIVRRDQSALWSAYADNLAQYGIRRVVFLDSQLAAALRWVQRRSLLRALPAL